MGREQKIVVDNKTYYSVKDACAVLGIGLTAVYEYRRKNHCTTEEAINAVLLKQQEPPKSYYAFGKLYDNVAQACRDYDVSGDMVRSFMRDKGYELEDAIELAKKHKAFNNKCVEKGINPYVARNFVRNYRCTEDEAIMSLSMAASSKG